MKRLLLLLIIVCGSLNLTSAPNDEEYLRRAIDLINIGNYQDAAGELQKIKEWGGIKQDSTIFLNTDSAFRAVDYFVRTSQSKDLINGFRVYFLINKDLYSLGISLYKEGKIKQALPLFEWMASIYRDVGGNQSALYAEMSNNLGVIYSDLGDYPLSIEYHLQAAQIRKVVLGEKNPIYASSLQNLGSTYTEMGDYENAEFYKLEALRIRKEVYGENSLEYALSLNGLGVLYDEWGKFKNSEQYYFQALRIRQTLLGQEHQSCAYTLCNIGALYLHMGDFAKAEQYLLKSLDICQSTLGEHHPLYASIINNIGGAYCENQKYVQAKSYLEKALEICESTYGKNNSTYVTYLSNIGSLYSQLGEFQEAERFLLEALNIQNGVDGHPKTYLAQNNLGDLYYKMGLYSKALNYYTEAMDNHTSLLGEDHPDVATILGNIGLVYREMGDESNAISYLLKSLNIYRKHFSQSLNFMSEKQRNSYWNKMRIGFEKDLPMSAYRHTLDKPLLSSVAYNNENFIKGLLLQSSDAIKRSILGSQDSILLEQWSGLISTQCYLNKLTNTNPFSQLILQYEHQADSLEKIITIKSAAYRENQAMWQITWDSIRNHLYSNQIAIEYMVAPLNGDSTMYCALLLRDTCSYPVMIPLFNESEVTPLVNTSTENQTSFTYSFDGNGKQLSQLVWSKVLPYIKKGETIYFAPSGLLHQLAIESLPYDENHTMADIFNLVRLSSTREIVLNKNRERHYTAALYGGIKYNVDADNLLAESEKYPEVAKRGVDNDTINRGEIRYLKGSKIEVENINKLFRRNKIRTQLFTSTCANEESFKALSGKHQNILHIATHGFFWTDSTAQKKEYFSQCMLTLDNNMPSPPAIDPLNRCGLLFAGAQTAWSGHSSELPEGVQDGILTAKEISLLDLRDADLVVLSACETGKGEITGDGVFGLQRAFKQAGAQTIIMSLWPVNDAATQLLMTEFYRNWITNHQSKCEAFKNAQNTVRSKYEEPIYWAGFIMLD